MAETEQAEANPALEQRGKRRRQRMEALAKARPAATVRVLPKNDDYRRVLKHPNGMRFRDDGGSVEWPLDRFTRRRIADGSVTVEETDTETENQ